MAMMATAIEMTATTVALMRARTAALGILNREGRVAAVVAAAAAEEIDTMVLISDIIVVAVGCASCTLDFAAQTENET
jgi:hypothetical protein